MIDTSLRTDIILNENIDDNLTAIQESNPFNVTDIMTPLYEDDSFHG